jgi:hypothetical protein
MRRGDGRFARPGRALVATGAALLMTAVGLGFAPAANAQVANTPDRVVAGNPSCEDEGYDHGFKVDSNELGDETYDVYDEENDGDTILGTLTIDWVEQEIDGKTEYVQIDWSSDGIEFEAVLVKAGNDANVYEYDPASDGDTALLTVGEHGISHISFCWGGDPGTEAETVTANATFRDPTCDVNSVGVTYDNDADIVYSVVGSIDFGEEVTVTAAIDPESDKVLHEDSETEWTHTFGPEATDCDEDTTTTNRRNRSSTSTTDMCVNIDGVQATIPAGLTFGPGKICSEPEAEVLAFTPDEVVPEVLPNVLVAQEPAPQLPFTGASSTIRLAAVATALLAIGTTMIAGGRRRPETLD